MAEVLPSRSFTSTDYAAALALDELCPVIVPLWNQQHPWFRRWGSNEAYMGIGVKRRVWKSAEGPAYRLRVNYQSNDIAGSGGTAVVQGGRSSQTVQFAPNPMQLHTQAWWEPIFYAYWIAVGIEDKMKITSAKAMVNYVQELFRINGQASARFIAKAMLAYGYTALTGKQVDTTTLADMAIGLQGISLGVRNDDPADGAGTFKYGNIERTTGNNAWWKSYVQNKSAAALTEGDLDTLLLSVMDGPNSPTIGCCSDLAYQPLLKLVRTGGETSAGLSVRRIIIKDDPTLGFSAPIRYADIPIMVDKTMSEPSFAASPASGTYPRFRKVNAGATAYDDPADADSRMRIRTGLFILNENEIEWPTWKNGTSEGGAPKVLADLEATNQFVSYGRIIWFGIGPVFRDPRRQGLVFNFT